MLSQLSRAHGAKSCFRPFAFGRVDEQTQNDRTKNNGQTTIGETVSGKYYTFPVGHSREMYPSRGAFPRLPVIRSFVIGTSSD